MNFIIIGIQLLLWCYVILRYNINEKDEDIYNTPNQFPNQ